MRLTTDQLEEIFESGKVTKQYEQHKRWSVEYLAVFERDGKNWGCYYRAPATESQDTGWSDQFDTVAYYDKAKGKWVFEDVVDCFEVEQVPSTEWKAKTPDVVKPQPAE